MICHADSSKVFQRNQRTIIINIFLDKFKQNKILNCNNVREWINTSNYSR